LRPSALSSPISGPLELYEGSYAYEPMDIASRTRQILSSRGLTLYRASERSAEIFGRASPYYIPENLYYQISVDSIIPNIHQLFALSRITNYRLCGWLRVFGFGLDDIPRLGAILSRQRTTILDSSVYDEEEWVPWPIERSPRVVIPAIAPLGQILARGVPRRAKELIRFNRSKFLYLKIGRQDALAFPDLMPGSIARVDVRRAGEIPREVGVSPRSQIFLAERASELNCCRLRRAGKDRVVLCSAQFPFAQVELELGREVRIRGVVDAEIRRLPGHPTAAPAPRKFPTERISGSPASLGELIRSSRMRAGFSFREASRTTRWISEMLEDPAYFSATGTLSDYETLSRAPRHIHKILSLCILYSIGFFDFLRTAGLALNQLGVDPIPDELVGRHPAHPSGESRDDGGRERYRSDASGFLTRLVQEWEEVPLFLEGALPGVLGLKGLGLSDVFWVGGDTRSLHPYLENAVFIALNRRQRKPVESTARPLWEQPIYLVLKRDGSYLCSCSTFREGLLVIHPYPDRPFAPRQLRNGIDAEVIGQVTAIVRRLG
jgi:hypothetical protein